MLPTANRNPQKECRKPTLTDRDDGVEAAVPDVDLVPAQLRHGVDLALAGEVGHLLVDVGRVGLLGEVGARRKHAHPGYLEQHSANLDTGYTRYYLLSGRRRHGTAWRMLRRRRSR